MGIEFTYIFIHIHYYLDTMNACQKDKGDIALAIHFTEGGDLTAQK